MEKNLNKEQLQELVKQLQTEKEFTLEQLEKKIDIDQVEICKKCKSPLAVVETAYDVGQNFKSFIVTQLIAERLKVPGLVTLYQVDKKSNEIINFRVKKIYPTESDGFYNVPPYLYVKWLKRLHEKHKC